MGMASIHPHPLPPSMGMASIHPHPLPPSMGMGPGGGREPREGEKRENQCTTMAMEEDALDVEVRAHAGAEGRERALAASDACVGRLDGGSEADANRRWRGSHTSHSSCVEGTSKKPFDWPSKRHGQVPTPRATWTSSLVQTNAVGRSSKSTGACLNEASQGAWNENAEEADLDVRLSHSAWVEATDRKAQQMQEKLERELAGYKTNLIKESIRMGHTDLGEFFFARGDYMDAFRSYVRTRDYCTTGKHVLWTCLGAIKAALAMGNAHHALSYVQKGEAVPDLANEPIVQAKFNAAAGLAQLMLHDYGMAGRRFCAVHPDLAQDPSWLGRDAQALHRERPVRSSVGARAGDPGDATWHVFQPARPRSGDIGSSLADLEAGQVPGRAPGLPSDGDPAPCFGLIHVAFLHLAIGIGGQGIPHGRCRYRSRAGGADWGRAGPGSHRFRPQDPLRPPFGSPPFGVCTGLGQWPRPIGGVRICAPAFQFAAPRRMRASIRSPHGRFPALSMYTINPSPSLQRSLPRVIEQGPFPPPILAGATSRQHTSSHRLAKPQSKMVRVVADQRMVLLGVLSGMALCAVPFAFDGFRKREQQVAELRDGASRACKKRDETPDANRRGRKDGADEGRTCDSRV
eukprot:scaffold840_cov344-Pavlova_lutheri.AAC.74